MSATHDQWGGYHPRVLMLGWEYPPRIAGGLGKACAGLAQAMARRGCQIYFVLPTFPQRVVEQKLHVMGARELMSEAGFRTPELQRLYHEESTRLFKQGVTDPDVIGRIVNIRARTTLFPYGRAPQEKLGHRRVKGLVETGRIEAPAPAEVTDLHSVSNPAIEEELPPAFDSKTRAALRRMVSAPEALLSEIQSMKDDKGEIYGRNMWSEIERYCAAIREIAQVYDAEAVHAHDWMSFPAALEYQRAKPHVPVFVHVHATEYDRSGENVNSDVYRVEREGFRRASHIFAVSQYTANVIERLYGIPREKITVAYNAPDEEVKKLIASPESGREPQVVFLGRLTFQKGPDHFLQAAKLVISAAPKRLGKIRFLLCGTGDMMDQLVALASELGIEDNVHFTGFLNPQDVDRVLMKSRVLVMPSVSEPFGLVALEAIHCGIPVILSKQSGVREVLQQALHVDFWDHEKLADQILAALRLKALSKQLVEEGIAQIRNLSWDRAAKTVIDTYRRFT